MKILFVTDLHGSQWKYDQLLQLSNQHKVSAVINGGDMLPKDGDLFQQDKFISNYLQKHFEQFNNSRIHYLCYLGNDDLKIFDSLFEKICSRFSFIHNIAQKKVEIKNYEFIGMNWVVDYPFRLKDRCRMDNRNYIFQPQFGSGVLSKGKSWKEIDDWPSYAKTMPTIEEEMEKLIRPKNIRKSIYVIHMPPAYLGLDKCGSGSEVGSKSIYRFIEKNQPLFTLHGHIHESPEMTGKWFSKVRKTICIQPGQLKELSYVIIDLDLMKYEKFLFSF